MCVMCVFGVAVSLSTPFFPSPLTLTNSIQIISQQYELIWEEYPLAVPPIHATNGGNIVPFNAAQNEYFVNAPFIGNSLCPYFVVDLDTGVWAPLKSQDETSQISYGALLAIAEETIVLIGGYFTLPQQQSPAGIWQFSRTSWMPIASSTLPFLYSHTAVIMDSEVYVFGGGLYFGKDSNAVYRMTIFTDPLRNTTTLLGNATLVTINTNISSSVLCERLGHTAVVVRYQGEQVMAIYGGMSDTARLGDLWVFNPRTRVWTMLYNAPLCVPTTAQGQAPQLAFHSAVAISTRKMIVIGGQTCSRSASNFSFVYDFELLEWSRLEAQNLRPVQSMSCGLAANNTILLVGGGLPLTAITPGCVSPKVAADFTQDPCEYCPAGTFYSVVSIYGDAVCKPCLGGTWSQPGATSQLQCNLCAPDLCAHGTCSIYADGPRCNCDLGYSGRSCDVSTCV